MTRQKKLRSTQASEIESLQQVIKDEIEDEQKRGRIGTEENDWFVGYLQELIKSA